MLSKAAISRLPAYLNLIRRLPPGTKTVSATGIARVLTLGEVQVRKDLAVICGKGKPKTGYDTGELQSALEAALGIHTQMEAVIVGAGKLGMALLGFHGFSDYGISIACAFDSNPDLRSAQVLPLSHFPSYCGLHQVEIGILCVPADAAQNAADLMVKNGIRAIWCFAVCSLRVPNGVTVQYENLTLSLAHLKSKVMHI